MIYILSITLNNDKKIDSELTKIYGVGKFQANILCTLLNFGNNCLIKDLTQTQIYQLLKLIESTNLKIGNHLQKQKQDFINQFIDLKCYKGIRHIFNLPVRGQRTRTNAKTKTKHV